MPFKMNRSQLFLHHVLKQQKSRTGLVRAILLKCDSRYLIRQTVYDQIEFDRLLLPGAASQSIRILPLQLAQIGQWRSLVESNI